MLQKSLRALEMLQNSMDGGLAEEEQKYHEGDPMMDNYESPEVENMN